MSVVYCSSRNNSTIHLVVKLFCLFLPQFFFFHTPPSRSPTPLPPPHPRTHPPQAKKTLGDDTWHPLLFIYLLKKIAFKDQFWAFLKNFKGFF